MRGGFGCFHLRFNTVEVPLGFLDTGDNHNHVALLDHGFYFYHGRFRYAGEVLGGARARGLIQPLRVCRLGPTQSNVMPFPGTSARRVPLPYLLARVLENDEFPKETLLKQGGAEEDSGRGKQG